MGRVYGLYKYKEFSWFPEQLYLPRVCVGVWFLYLQTCFKSFIAHTSYSYETRCRPQIQWQYQRAVAQEAVCSAFKTNMTPKRQLLNDPVVRIGVLMFPVYARYRVMAIRTV